MTIIVGFVGDNPSSIPYRVSSDPFVTTAGVGWGTWPLSLIFNMQPLENETYLAILQTIPFNSQALSNFKLVIRYVITSPTHTRCFYCNSLDRFENLGSWSMWVSYYKHKMLTGLVVGFTNQLHLLLQLTVNKQ